MYSPSLFARQCYDCICLNSFLWKELKYLVRKVVTSRDVTIVYIKSWPYYIYMTMVKTGLSQLLRRFLKKIFLKKWKILIHHLPHKWDQTDRKIDHPVLKVESNFKTVQHTNHRYIHDATYANVFFRMFPRRENLLLG